MSDLGGGARRAQSSKIGTVIIIVIILAIVAGGAVFAWHGLTAPLPSATGNQTVTTSPTSPTSTPSEEPAASVDPNRIVVSQATPGVCFNEQAMSDSKGTYIWMIDCTQPHDSEVFYAAEMADGAYPDADGWKADVLQYCHPEFATYTGVTYGENTLQIKYLYPPESSWSSGNRMLVCYAVGPAGQTSSIKVSS